MKTLNLEEREELVEFLGRIQAEIGINRSTGQILIEYVNDQLSSEEIEIIRTKLTELMGEDGFQIVKHIYDGEYVSHYKIDSTKNCEICNKRLKSCKGHKMKE